jgi:hypothetical protein
MEDDTEGAKVYVAAVRVSTKRKKEVYFLTAKHAKVRKGKSLDFFQAMQATKFSLFKIPTGFPKFFFLQLIFRLCLILVASIFKKTFYEFPKNFLSTSIC